MDTAEHFEAPRKTDPVEGRRGHPSVDNEQTPPWDPRGPFVPDEAAFETFVDGSGI
jgi:hypothetical protein